MVIQRGRARTAASRAGEQFELPIRVTIVRPPAGVQFAIQGSRSDDLAARAVSNGEDVSFDVAIRVSLPATGPPRFLGPFTHGSPDDRFLYIGVGTYAGQADSCWSRRAKVPLTGITRKLISEARRTGSGRLEGRVWGAGRDGGPLCARVDLLDGGWRCDE